MAIKDNELTETSEYAWLHNMLLLLAVALNSDGMHYYLFVKNIFIIYLLKILYFAVFSAILLK